MAFDASGQRLLSTGEDGKISLWDMKTWPPILLKDFPESKEKVYWAAFSPDGSKIVGVGRDCIVRIFDASNNESTELFGHKNTIFHAVFSPDGGQVATVSGDVTIRLWDIESGDELFILPLHSGLTPLHLRDFDFRCGPQSPSGGECWLIVPLTRGKLALYNMGNIYD